MLNREDEERWKAVKESYREAVIFYKADGLVIVGGSDVEVLRKELGIRAAGAWLGFDGEQADAYMVELVRRGYEVARASPRYVWPVKPPTDRRKEIQRQRRQGKFLAVEPTLLFDRTYIERAANDKWLQKRGYEELFDRFRHRLNNDDLKALAEYGELFVYQVGDWYEIDHELTSMLSSHVLLLAKAALATGRKLPCRVVEPRSWRQRKSPKRVLPHPSV